MVAASTHGVQSGDPVIVVAVGDSVGVDLLLECGVDLEWQVLTAHTTGAAATTTSARHDAVVVGFGVKVKMKLMKSSESQACDDECVVARWSCERSDVASWLCPSQEETDGEE